MSKCHIVGNHMPRVISNKTGEKKVTEGNTNLKKVFVLCVLKGWLFVLIQRADTSSAGCISKSYTMGCPPVRGDNPRALASGLSYIQVNKHGITILYHLHQCRPYTSQDISC